jgi:hypothetical protein
VTSYSAIITGFVRRPCSMSLASNHADASQGFTARAFFVDSTKALRVWRAVPVLNSSTSLWLVW